MIELKDPAFLYLAFSILKDQNLKKKFPFRHKSNYLKAESPFENVFVLKKKD